MNTSIQIKIDKSVYQVSLKHNVKKTKKKQKQIIKEIKDIL